MQCAIHEMAPWQALLVEFAKQDAPVPLSKLNVPKMPKAAFQEALIRLQNLDFVHKTGTIFLLEGHVPLYEITPAGLLAVIAGVHKLGHDQKVEVDRGESLARRVVEKNPVSVFDLARAPWQCDVRPPLEKLAGVARAGEYMFRSRAKYGNTP